jgi:hypothetical protein
MSINPLAIVVFAIAFVPGAIAGDTAKPALPTKTSTAFELKNKSSFAVPEGTRSPFKPIGGKVTQPIPSTKNLNDGSAFRVTSILVGSPSLAVINGRSYEEGQMIRMPKASTKANEPGVRVKLFRIGDGVVYLQVEDQVITVPIKRGGELKELQREELLNMERE